MRKFIAGMKVSLDMKFQADHGYADWVDGWSEDYGLFPGIEACLMGGAMYRGYERYWSAMAADPHAPSPMTGAVPTEGELAWSETIPRLPHYVLSRDMSEAAWPNTRFLHSEADVEALKAQEGGDIYVMGGGGLVQRLVECGLLDEIRLIIYPVIAGGPHTLFGADMLRRHADLIRTEVAPDARIRADYRLLARQTAVAA
jgi:dihydrofolate reductase